MAQEQSAPSTSTSSTSDGLKNFISRNVQGENDATTIPEVSSAEPQAGAREEANDPAGTSSSMKRNSASSGVYSPIDQWYTITAPSHQKARPKPNQVPDFFAKQEAEALRQGVRSSLPENATDFYHGLPQKIVHPRDQTARDANFSLLESSENQPIPNESGANEAALRRQQFMKSMDNDATRGDKSGQTTEYSLDETFSATDAEQLKSENVGKLFDATRLRNTDMNKLFQERDTVQVEVLTKCRLLPIASLFANYSSIAKNELYNAYRQARDVYEYACCNRASPALSGRCAFYVGLAEFILTSEGLRSPPPVSGGAGKEIPGQTYFEEALLAKGQYDEGDWAEEWMNKINGEVASELSPRSRTLAARRGFGILGRAFNALTGGWISEERHVSVDDRRRNFLSRTNKPATRRVSPIPQQMPSFTSWGSGDPDPHDWYGEENDSRGMNSRLQSVASNVRFTSVDLPPLNSPVKPPAKSPRKLRVTNPDPSTSGSSRGSKGAS